MKRIFSSLLFTGLLLALGAAAFLAYPGGGAEVVESNPVADAGAAPAAQASAATGPKFNTLVVVLESGLSVASDLLTDIEATTAITVQQILKYDPAFGFITYDPGNPFSSNFSLTTGLPVFILAQGSQEDAYTIVGDVPAEGSVSFSLTGSSGACTYNFISVPLDQGSITLASELITAIGDVSEVLKYDPTFGYITYDPLNPFSSDFAVNIGYPYFVCMNASKTWPQ